MDNRTTILILPAVLIAAMLSGCMQETSEIGTPDATPPAQVSEVTSRFMTVSSSFTNWNYVSYRNLSISNAPALNQTARITYSIIPDRDIEDLLVYISFRDGFEFVDVEGERLLTWCGKMPVGNLERCARWCPTNLSKGKMYQFSATIKAVKTGNWTITGLDWEDRVYISVSEDYAYLSDGPFPEPPSVTYFLDESGLNESEIEKALANIPTNEGLTVYRSTKFPITTTTTPSKPSKHTTTLRPTPCPTSCSFDVNLGGETCTGLSYHWNGTAWVERNNQS